jgi:bifunctional DNase/RNase
VRLARGGDRIELRAVPSESIALAVSSGARILTSRRLLDEAGLTRADLDRIHRSAGKAPALRL